MNRSVSITVALAAVASALFAVAAPAHASEADDKIESSFKDSYVNRTYLKDDDIDIDVDQGVVTLTGTVAEKSRKGLAQETAAGLPGVTRVDNRLSTPEEEAAENADTWMARKVKLALLFHLNVSGSQTSVDVKDGIVTLRGEASSEAQKQLTGEYAGDIEGVRKVNNEMTVSTETEVAERSAGQKIDDASVTALVKTALSTHRSTSALTTGVVTRNGEVTITGIARNAAERALVSKLIDGIRGVDNVINEMTLRVTASR